KTRRDSRASNARRAVIVPGFATPPKRAGRICAAHARRPAGDLIAGIVVVAHDAEAVRRPVDEPGAPDDVRPANGAEVVRVVGVVAVVAKHEELIRPKRPRAGIAGGAPDIRLLKPLPVD